MPTRDQLLQQIKWDVQRILNVLPNKTCEALHYLQLARQLTWRIDQLRFRYDRSQLPEYIWLIQSLQRYSASVREIAGTGIGLVGWCEQQWNNVLQLQPESSPALIGLAKYWLSRADSVMDRVYLAETAVCGQPGGLPPQILVCSVTKRALSAGAAERALESRLEQLRHRQEFVEARALLTAATSFFNRAITATPSNDPAYGDLLIEASQAYIQLGVVQFQGASLEPFLRASRMLTRAKLLPGLILPKCLQGYLDEYGRYS